MRAHERRDRLRRRSAGLVGERSPARWAVEGAGPQAAEVAAVGAHRGAAEQQAQAFFAFTFRGPRPQFWKRMTLTGLSLGSFALLYSQLVLPTPSGAGTPNADTFRIGGGGAGVVEHGG